MTLGRDTGSALAWATENTALEPTPESPCARAARFPVLRARDLKALKPEARLRRVRYPPYGWQDARRASP